MYADLGYEKRNTIKGVIILTGKIRKYDSDSNNHYACLSLSTRCPALLRGVNKIPH